MTSTSSGLTVMVDGQPVPLDACGWFEREPCGCIVSAAVAVVGERVLATAEQVTQHWHRTKRERERAAKAGLRVELMTMAHYREHIGSKWECAEHAPAAPEAAL